MKKHLMKLGALAVAAALALAFAACAQPTDESSGAGTPTILRLYLDKDLTQTTIQGSPQIQIRVGTLDPEAKENNLTTNNAIPFQNSNVTTYRRDGNGDVDPFSTLYLETPQTTLLTSSGTVAGNVTNDVEDAHGYYVDLELVNRTFDSLDRDKIYTGSDSFYLEFEQLGGTAIGSTGTNPIVVGQKYYYTPDNLSTSADPDDKDNGRIQPIDLSPGVNVIRLRYFNSVM
jgi:hypothetical protein